MPIKSLSQSSLLNFEKYSSMLAGNEAYSPSSDDFLEEVILTSSASSIEFTGLIASYGSTYKHLQLRGVTKSNRASDGDYVELQFNSDTGTNYAVHAVLGNGSSASSYGFSSTDNGYAFRTAGTTTANCFGAGITDILDPFDTSKNTTVRGFGGVVGGTTKEVVLNSSGYFQTGAIDSILAFPAASADFLSGTRLSLYGSKG